MEQLEQLESKAIKDRLARLALLVTMELLEARAQQALLVDRDQRGQPELLALMVLQELLA
jgi:hypothetical protein